MLDLQIFTKIVPILRSFTKLTPINYLKKHLGDLQIFRCFVKVLLVYQSADIPIFTTIFIICRSPFKSCRSTNLHKDSTDLPIVYKDRFFKNFIRSSANIVLICRFLQKLCRSGRICIPVEVSSKPISTNIFF